MATLYKHSLNFLADALHKMLSCTPTRDRYWSDWRVGLSCWCYLAPAIVIWLIAMNLRNCISYELALYIIVPTNSFVADYIFMGKVSVWHMIDRWTATIAFILNIIKVLLISMTIIDMIIIAIFGYLSLVLLNGSRKAKSVSTFQKYHIGWHIIGGVLMSWIVIMEHTEFNNLDHPIIQIKDYLFASGGITASF